MLELKIKWEVYQDIADNSLTLYLKEEIGLIIIQYLAIKYMIKVLTLIEADFQIVEQVALKEHRA